MSVALVPLLPILAAALFYLATERWLRRASREVAVLGLLALVSSGLLLTASDLLGRDPITTSLGWIILAAGAAALFVSPDYLEARHLGGGDFTALLLLAVAGLMLLVMARELLGAILALETASVCLYALTGYDRRRESSAEAALKYFLPGAAASAILLFGAACFYGATGTTALGLHPGLGQPLGLLGSGLLLSGLAFKAGLVPFHGWLPDAYAGAPAPATAFMAAAVKAAGFGVLLRFAASGMPSDPLVLVAMLTMTFGNLAGLAQTALKRLLAYSAIAHSGYLLLGILAGAPAAVASYLLAYGLLTVGAFAAAGALESPATGGLEIAQLRGLASRRPLLALSLAFCLLGLAGMPPTAGFLAKVNLFAAAWDKGLAGLVIAAVLNSVLALGYYLKPVLAMFMQELPEGAQVPPVERVGAATAVAFACGAGGLVLGVWPALWMS